MIRLAALLWVGVAPTSTFALVPATGFPGASGDVALRPAWSPFDVALTRDGFLVYDLTITVAGLPDAKAGQTFVAWLATPDLDRVRRLGVVREEAPLTGRVDWNQFLVIVTLESGDPGDRWAGPTVLMGRSPSSLIRPLWGHSIFRPTPF